MNLKDKVIALESVGSFDEPYLPELLKSARRHLKNVDEAQSFHNGETIINRMYEKYCVSF